MTLNKEDSLLEEEVEAEEDNSNILNVARWDIDLLSVQITKTQAQAQELFLLLQQWKEK